LLEIIRLIHLHCLLTYYSNKSPRWRHLADNPRTLKTDAAAITQEIKDPGTLLPRELVESLESIMINFFTCWTIMWNYIVDKSADKNSEFKNIDNSGSDRKHEAQRNYLTILPSRF